MLPGNRLIIWVIVAGLCAALSARRLPRGDSTAEVTRWFVPGAFGAERGRADERINSRGGTADRPSTQSPGFVTRAFSGLAGKEGAEWGARNGLTPSLAFSHHLTEVFPPGLYKQHPEFFPFVDGKRLDPPRGSWFWNPDIAREDVAWHAAAVARDYFTAHPGETSFALGVNDALIWGDSPELVALARSASSKWFRERPNYSNVVFTFMNRAAAELSRTHDDKYLGCLAYYWCEAVPDFPVHPQVIPFLTADRSQGYDSDFRDEEFRLQEQWGRLARERNPPRDAGDVPSDTRGKPPAAPVPPRLGMYDYIYGGGFLIPRIHTRLLAGNLRHARRAGFTDYYAEVNPNWGLDGPMPWLTAQLLEDPERSAGRLLDEYYARYFQDSAAPMRRFFEKCEGLWMAQPGPAYWLKHYRNESQAIVFPPAARGELRMLLMEGGVLARTRKVQQRMQLVSDAFGVTERFCAMYEARDAVIRQCLEPSLSAARVENALLDYLNARRDFIRYTAELRRDQPMALQGFLWNDYLKNDPVPLAVFALRNSATREKNGEGTRADAFLLPASLGREPLVRPLSVVLRRDWGQGSRELLRDPGMTGNLKPPRMIAGLPYGVPLPEPWQGKVEPAEFHQAALTGSGTRVLRVSGTKDTMVSQWAPVTAIAGESQLHVARLSLRGRVSPSTAVSLILAWLDAQQRHVGFKSVRLPDGTWPAFVTLRQAGPAPAGAVWVGVGLRVQNQVKADWVEATNFSLTQEPSY